jgi:magnesium chelatase subunit ChlI-like protein
MQPIFVNSCEYLYNLSNMCDSRNTESDTKSDINLNYASLFLSRKISTGTIHPCLLCLVRYAENWTTKQNTVQMQRKWGFSHNFSFKLLLKSVRSFVHNILMVGSPGAGKTLLARAMPGILPEMSIEESLDVTRIYSVADQLPAGTPLIRHRPFRAPHHTISHAGLVGGGNIPKPGEISLAHRGVLFLDEFPEFGTRGLEVMCQPMEDKVVTISRAKGSLTFSANFQLIAAMNPCP